MFLLTGSGLGAVGAMIWARYQKDTFPSSIYYYKLILDSFPQNYLSFTTNTNQYKSSLQNMMKLANVDESHPFSLCAVRH